MTWHPGASPIRALTEIKGCSHAFRKLIEGAPSISNEVRLVDRPSVDAVIGHGLTSDLAIVGSVPGGDTDATTARDLPEQVVLHAGRPVLVVPCANAGAAPQDEGDLLTQAGVTLQVACGDRVTGRTTARESLADLTAAPKASSRAA